MKTENMKIQLTSVWDAREVNNAREQFTSSEQTLEQTDSLTRDNLSLAVKSSEPFCIVS